MGDLQSTYSAARRRRPSVLPLFFATRTPIIQTTERPLSIAYHGWILELEIKIWLKHLVHPFPKGRTSSISRRLVGSPLSINFVLPLLCPGSAFVFWFSSSEFLSPISTKKWLSETKCPSAYCRDRALGSGYYAVQGHSMSLIFVPIESHYVTFYWRIILTYILYLTICQI